jgi:hypothetical protein
MARRIKFSVLSLFFISSIALAVDSDGDGYDDSIDKFPADPTEWFDTDLDGIGNNTDPDVDGDGLLNGVDNNIDGDAAINIYDPFPNNHHEWLDTDNDNLGNNEDTDDDNDGVPDLLDVFPLDVNESLDSDGDNIGNNADNNDDNDSLIDVYDAFPLDPLETVDTDFDGIGNNADDDDDNDGILDINDAFPLDFNESADLDGDGIGNGADNDIDGDGIANGNDVWPYDPTEWFDNDGDTIGDNADLDDDNDGTLDVDDALPFDNTETKDLDLDGIGDNSDPDIDGDGFANNIDGFLGSCKLLPLERFDTDQDGICDNTDTDDDGDGEPDVTDAFRLDPAEQKDLDNDGLGDKNDIDIDGDGVTNGPFDGNYNDPLNAVFGGSDKFPFDATEYIDTDGDGLGNTLDLDDDGDGEPDVTDVFPLDPSEQFDLDGDGIGNNTDPDRDGDGTPNGSDALPDNLLETRDTDGDGIGNDADLDDDTHDFTGVGDGVPDILDDFDFNPLEWKDSDGDGIGDNADSDDDNDGFPDAIDDFDTDPSEWLNTDANHPTNSDLIGNNQDLDDDGDGEPDATDRYPLNANEQFDSDGDGIGDNADSDDDNDGYTDVIDAFKNDPLEWFDTDFDGIGNNADLDDDGDGVLDKDDLFPLNPLEWEDADHDGLGNNEDSDDDNDGIRDEDDEFPFNPIESTDTDGDGLGNIFDTDDDGDGTLDIYDDLPLDPTEQVDTDKDQIGNNADLDDDNDGMSDEFELLYGFDTLDAKDGLLDTDNDGIANYLEAKAQTNPLLDDYAPIITPPQAVNINAKHTFTKLDLVELIALTQVSVSDGKDGENCCGLTALGFENGPQNIESGRINIKWRAVDDAGNIAEKDQVINVYPLVNFSSKQVVAEGGIATVDVVLSGVAPSYPLELPLTISGNVDAADYQLSDNKIIIYSGTTGSIDIQLIEDLQLEGDEELIISFEQGVNGGINAKHSIVITENNVAPTTAVSIVQQNISVSSIAKNDGEVAINLIIKDSNINDSHVIEWSIPDYLNAEISANQLAVFLQPEEITLPEENKGLITFSVKVTDDGSDNNNDNLSQTHFISTALLEQQPRLANTDTDRDGISDISEGFVDNDFDGLPAFMDNSTIPYLQPLHVNAAIVKLMETEPGLQLVLGKYARLQYSDGVQLSTQEVTDTQLIVDDTLSHQNEYFDFEIKGIAPFGRSVYTVIPLQNPIPKFPVYRKFSELNGWQDFVINSNNALATSAMINGVCPPPHSDLYTEGLTLGDYCLRLFIEDGGVNDADGIANGVIVDPGGIAVVADDTIAKTLAPEKSSSGSVSWLVLFVLVLFRKFRLSINKTFTLS